MSSVAGVQIEVGFQKSEYAVSESYGSVAPIIIVEGNVSASFDIMITAISGTALCKSLLIFMPQISHTIYYLSAV